MAFEVMAVVALDLGGTKLAAAIFTSRGRMVCRAQTALAGRRGAGVAVLVRQEVLRLLELAAARRMNIRAIGVSVPGISFSNTGRVWAPNIPGWTRYPLRRELESLVRGRRLRVAVENDRACSILGEAWRGAARGRRHAIFLAVGTGIGAGILSDGEVLRGAHDIAGSLGWLALQRPFRRKYRGCGCFEYHASGRGLAKVARELRSQLPPQFRPPGRRKPARSWTAADVFAAYERKDPLARAVLRQAIEFWGMAVANLVSLFNPEVLIFGGGVFGPATRFLSDIYAAANDWAQPIAIKQVKLLPAKLGGDAALYGAARLALQASR